MVSQGNVALARVCRRVLQIVYQKRKTVFDHTSKHQAMIENMTGSEVFFNELRGDGNFAKHRLKEKMEN